MSSKRADLEALRRDAVKLFTDPEERARALRDLDELEKVRADSERMHETLARAVQADKASERRWLVATIVVCTLIAVIGAIWLPYERAVGLVAICVFGAGLAFIATLRKR